MAKKAKLILGILAVAICIVLAVVLIRVIVNGAQALRDIGERPIETAAPDDLAVWSAPTVAPQDEADVDAPPETYKPEIEDNAQFDAPGDEGEDVPVDALPEDLAGTTPAPEDEQFPADGDF